MCASGKQPAGTQLASGTIADAIEVLLGAHGEMRAIELTHALQDAGNCSGPAQPMPPCTDPGAGLSIRQSQGEAWLLEASVTLVTGPILRDRSFWVVGGGDRVT